MTSGFDRTFLDVDVQAHIRRAHVLRSRYVLACLRALVGAARGRLSAVSRQLLARRGRPSGALRSGYQS